MRRIANSEDGFTLLELLAVVAIVGILASTAVPMILDAIEDARYASAIQDLTTYRTEIQHMITTTGEVPSTWGDLGYDEPPTDPWGNEYVLNNHDDISRGTMRKDGPTVPINSYFDLFSPGPNGTWSSPIQAPSSLDDVIVAGDGQFVGRASEF